MVQAIEVTRKAMMESKKETIIDISPALRAATPVWPGDTSLSQEILCRLSEGASVFLSTLHTTVHIGAHADAPNHYKEGAGDIASVDLSAYIGSCQVITVETIGAIKPEAFAGKWIPGIRRVLFRTNSFDADGAFTTDFCFFAPESISLLGKHGCCLVGIDTPSVDAFDSKSLPAHHELARWEMRNLEGLCLDAVIDGIYELIALPLKLQGFDASPVRAILRPIVSPL